MTAEHGTATRYRHGPGNDGLSGGCRCEDCRAFMAADARRAYRLRAYGQWQPFTDAEPARQHVRDLIDGGVGWTRVADLAGVARHTVARLLGHYQGRPPSATIRPETERKILALRMSPALLAGCAWTDAAGTRRRLQALIAAGHTRVFLATRLGMAQPSNFSRLMRAPRVTTRMACAVRDMYGDLWDAPPCQSTPRDQRQSARARADAAARGWPPPMAWDDDQIDDPAARPADGWKRPGRLSREDSVAEITELIASEGSISLAAERFGRSRHAVDKILERDRKAS